MVRACGIKKKDLREKYPYRKKFARGKPLKDFTLTLPSLQHDLYIDIPVSVYYMPKHLQDMFADSLAVAERFLLLPKDIIPLKNRVFSDADKHKSMVVFPPEDKMAVQGYVHIAIGLGKHLYLPDALIRALFNLSDALNIFTNITTSYDKPVFMDHPKTIDELD